MSFKAGSRLAWAGFGVAYLLIALAIALAALSAPAFKDPQLVGALAQAIVPPMAIAVTGVLIASRLPGNRLGWVLLAASIVSAFSGVLLTYQIHGLLSNPGSLPAVEWAAWLSSGLSAVLYPGIVLLILLLFPDGRLPSPAWRILVVVDIAFVGLNFLVGALDPTPIANAGLPAIANPTGMTTFKGVENGPLGWITFLGQIPLVLAGLASLIVRLRRAPPDVRRQIRWVIYALVISILLPVLMTLSTLVIPPSPTGRLIGNVIASLMVTLGFGVLVPAAMAVAILKYRLYDIDIVISRTLVYAALAVFITVVYVGVVVGMGTLIGSRNRPNLLLSIAATGVVALAFQPFKRRAEALANRLVYGYRATPYEVLIEFSHRITATYADEDVLVRLARVMVEGTGGLLASVWLEGSANAAATWPIGVQPLAAESADRLVTVRHLGEVLGHLAIKTRTGEPFTPVEDQLITDVAAQAGQVLRNVRLDADLKARLEQVAEQSAELRASRQRIVAAQDAERRRLERNIHDGAQQHLVALAVNLRLAAGLAKRDHEKARKAISNLVQQTTDAIGTLRDLAQGIYPPALREGGLERALGAIAPVEAHGITRYRSDVEAAVYFCCLEALQNSAKYAHASKARVELRQVSGTLHFVVEDDGTGFDPARVRPGSGLQNMRDRIASLGGALEVVSAPGWGTRVSGTMPVGEALSVPVPA